MAASASEAESGAAMPLLALLRRPLFAERPLGRLSAWHWVGWFCLLLLVAGVVGGLEQGLLAPALGWHTSRDAFLKYVVTHPSLLAAAMLLVAPILEELAFRAFLSTDPRAVFTGLAFFFVYVYGMVHARIVLVRGAYALAHFWRFAVALVPAAIISLMLYRVARTQVMGVFRNHSAWVFWISCIVFGAAHATGYTQAWWGLVLALPQFVVGVGLAHIRIAFGLRWSMLTHWVYDWLLMGIAWAGLSLAPHGVAWVALGDAEAALGLLVLAYGLVALVRVLRRRW